MNANSTLTRLLQIATVTVFLGRGWQFLSVGAPYRTLLWDEGWMSWLVENVFQTSWGYYVTSPKTDAAIQSVIAGTGVFYLFCAVVVLLIWKVPKWLTNVLWIGSIGLFFLAFLYFKERFFQLGQLLEYSLQFSAPLFLFLLVRQKLAFLRLLFWIKVAIALTFISHGLYAIGYYPRPGGFTEMVLNILPISELQVGYFLVLVGILDFVFAALLFLRSKTAFYAAAYLTFWGMMTTLARLWSYFQIDFWQETLSRWLPETLMRLPHFLIPLMVCLYLYLTFFSKNTTVD
ncbi:MAG: hypothetical protein AAGI23_12755 [Bacteroidota bacterium]